MTTLESLVHVSHVLLRANGRWCVSGIDETLRRDIRNTVTDVARLFRDDINIEKVTEMAITELEELAVSLAA